jgi:intracellular septation protein
MRLTDAGWHLLSLRFALFFFFLAALNEVLRRVLSSDAWVNFKVFGVLGATLVFTLLQTPLIQKHALEEPEG